MAKKDDKKTEAKAENTESVTAMDEGRKARLETMGKTIERKEPKGK